MKRVVSFSLYGNRPVYVEGAVENAKLVAELLPGWVARFYVDRNHPVIPRLRGRGAEVVEQEPSPDSRGMFWRFEALFDPEVERFISRDTDSRILQRDVVTLRDWITSGKPYVLWRDHPAHLRGYPVLGGMWGARRIPEDGAELELRMRRWVARHVDAGHVGYNCDQAFLKSCLDIIGRGKPWDARLLAFCFSPRPRAFEAPFPDDAEPRVSDKLGFIGARVQPTGR